MTTNDRQPDSQMDIAAIRARLAGAQGKEYWRSLEELAESEAFQESVKNEFPSGASEWNDAIGRRRFLRLMGASLALAGLTACTRQPTETIVPYVHPAEGITLGEPLYFATAMPMCGATEGLLVESHEGRPTKIEGNPNHPASLGATSLFAQASVLTLYNPDRARTITNIGEIRSWGAFANEIQQAMTGKSASQGAGLRILTGAVSSPTLVNQIKSLLAAFPAAKWHQYEPVNRDNAVAGARMAFGEPVNTVYRFENADVILAFDADFLTCGPANARYAREFAKRRRLLNGDRQMNRLYVVESSMTNTGAVADHRIPLRPSEIESFARAVAAGLGVQSGVASMKWRGWIDPLARDLQQHRGRSLVIAGDSQPPAVHALAAIMNQTLGAAGGAVMYTAPVEADAIDQTQSLSELARDMDAGQVDLLVIIGCNPVYDAPVDLQFAERMSKVKTRVHLSLFNDETSELCHWHIPESHYLETWGDARAYDGTVTIIQPLIAPLYGSKSAHELLAALANQPQQSSYDIVRAYWMGQRGAKGQVTTQSAVTGARPQAQPKAQSQTQPQTRSQAPSPAFEQWWQEALQTGVAPDTAFKPKQVSAKTNWLNQNPATSPTNPTELANPSGDQNALEIIFRPDPSIYDGRFAHNGWLQELPKPLTKLAWGNAIEISPATAERFGLSYEIPWRGGEHGQALVDVVELQYKGRKLLAPIWITPGHADGCATVHLGYGRARGGSVGAGLGFNAYAIRTSDAPWFDEGLTIRKTGQRQPLATTQLHYTMEGRDLARSATLDEFLQRPNFAREENPPPDTSLYPEWPYTGYAWGMAIDLNACVGCNACVVACQSENNIPVVGKEQVMHGREMHWLRIDRYFAGALDHPETYFQPVPCMHCEKAPCELVCPVVATVHSSEGLNDQVYNRCVGTRYCSNNCPYKVRRFNFFLYQDWTTPQLKMQRNPDVTVRSRGVMEKCTYCVQRIQEAKIAAEKEERKVRDGDIKTACQQSCPAEAIVFGDINDPQSRVAKLKQEPRNYALLAELNTRPRTTYLAAVRNPNPEIESEELYMSRGDARKK
ncbi:MAG TPA: TAT-variant-translocated molybdopterin oxidoreductase [Blastocatellia bacterium]|jgi:molybdopterin-containing oxidoreductase family iron-sulfur binding subunit|nr:TAT-variant-translocated molybdopterin oxidoreductase [Blastocatellia bacterium]